MVVALLFYEQNNEKCEQVLDMLEELDIKVATADVYDEENLTLIDQYNICCVPTVIFFPSFNVYLPEHISREAFELEVEQKI